MAQVKRLSMIFKDQLDNNVTISIDEPKEAITETEIKDCMDLIVSKNIFTSPRGLDIKTPVEAKITTTDITEYDLVID